MAERGNSAEMLGECTVTRLGRSAAGNIPPLALARWNRDSREWADPGLGLLKAEAGVLGLAAERVEEGVGAAE